MIKDTAILNVMLKRLLTDKSKQSDKSACIRLLLQQQLLANIEITKDDR